MYTRITNQLMTSASKQNISDTLSQLYDLERQASTGKRYANASDNPSVAAKGISLRSTMSQIQTYQSTMNTTSTWLDTTDETLQKIVSELGDAQGAVLQALNGTQSAGERKVLGSTINGIIQELVDLGNTEVNGRYIFSGLKTDTAPFVLASGSSGSPVSEIKMNMSVTSAGSGSVTLNGLYVGTDLSTPNKISINGTSVEINPPVLGDGSVNENYPTFYVGGKEIVPNPTTSTDIEVNGIPVSVDYSTGSPVFSVSGSTITVTGSPVVLTPANSVTIGYSGGAFTFSPTPATSGSVTGDPNSWYVNGIKITVQDPAASPPSFLIDGQLADVASNGFINLTNVTKHNGAEYGGNDPNFPTYRHDYVIYQGDAGLISRAIGASNTMTVNINGGDAFNQLNGMFDTLIKLRDILNGNDYVSPHVSTVNTSGGTTYEVAQEKSSSQSVVTSPRQPTVYSNMSPYLSIMSEAYAQLQSVSDDVSETVSINGTRMSNLENTINHSSSALLEIKALISNNEDVNMAEAAINVTNQQTVYDAVIAMSGKIGNLTNLFDKI
jgi:flagellin-like hook-associated protein FlgL